MKNWNNTIISVIALQMLCTNTAAAEIGKSKSHSAPMVATEIKLFSLVSSLLLPINAQHSSKDWSLINQYPINWDNNELTPSKKEQSQFTRVTFRFTCPLALMVQSPL